MSVSRLGTLFDFSYAITFFSSSENRSEALLTLDFWVEKVENDLEVRLSKPTFRKLKNKLNKIWRTKKCSF